MFVLICYVLCPIPSLVARRTEMDTASSLLNEICLFITAVIVTSAYGLPVILAHTPLDAPVVSCISAHLWIFILAVLTCKIIMYQGFFQPGRRAPKKVAKNYVPFPVSNFSFRLYDIQVQLFNRKGKACRQPWYALSACVPDQLSELNDRANCVWNQ